MEDYNARLQRETIENIAIADLLESLREDFEAAERELMFVGSAVDDQVNRAWRDGIQASFNRIYSILKKA